MKRKYHIIQYCDQIISEQYLTIYITLSGIAQSYYILRLFLKTSINIYSLIIGNRRIKNMLEQLAQGEGAEGLLLQNRVDLGVQDMLGDDDLSF
uniref:Uncharacterized protein n=1 Tax=Spironucleus salmonicida TaxID=348837 RepID=V6LSJ8_9EUKA|eukprot:EST43749.1 Hypothetical protein SS50377_16483 [Spironucleus salmonicida]